MLTRQRMLTFASTAAAALAIGACGGGDDGGVEDTDPASLAPADAPIYIQATLRPEGKLKSNVEALASTVSGFDDPTGRLIEELDKGLAEEDLVSGKTQTFAKDFEPWLGSQAGLFLEDLSDDPPAAAIIQATDPAAAEKAIQDAEEKGDTEGTYKGTRYYTDGGEDGDIYGVVGDFVVIGALSAFKQVVDVSEGEDSLGDQSQFTDALEQAPEGSIADVYASLEVIAEAVRREDPESAPALEAYIGETSGKSVIGSLIPAADSLELDIGTDADQSFELADLSGLIETFPADSHTAFGIPDLGGIINRTISQLEDAGIEGITRQAIDQQLSQTGLSIDDITRAVGDLGIFVTGTDEQTAQGAAVIASDDPEAARNLISKIQAITGLAQLSGAANISPAPVGTGVSITDRAELGAQPLIVTTEDDRIAIGYGEQATEQALVQGGGATLGDDPAFQDAKAALGGDDLSGYFSMPGIFRLAESLGAAADPDYRQAKPYLERLSYAVFGSGELGDFQNSKIIVGVSD